MRSSSPGKYLTLYGILALLGVVLIYPIWLTVRGGFMSADGGYTLYHVLDVFRDENLRCGLFNALTIATATTFLSIVISMPLALVAARHEFPGKTLSIWGQKTLQARPSALDRVNVRRLLIAVKKFIASSTKFLVFEQNTSATRTRFLSIVNPYLEQVRAQQGLSAFRVVMDETNNTPDVIDQNIMYGQIFLQPTRTAEFIVLDFNIQPTGAAFPE